ncbi:MAG: hypothetical protein JNM79_12230 [Burkholderiales bacterium]|nr:hypothetical protein [Burkholderiales bacterium]
MSSPLFAAARFTAVRLPASRLSAPRPAASCFSIARLLLPAARLTAFLRSDRDRWVMIVCALGFSLLTGIDWLAA